MSIDEFLKECTEYNKMTSEDKKFEKCLKLIDNSSNLGIPDEKDELLYYSFLAELYYYASKIKSVKYKLSNGIIFDVDAILDEKNKQHLEEILEYKIMSFNNYKKSLDNEIIKKSSEKIKAFNKSISQLEIDKNINGVCYRNREGFRILAQDLSSLYYITNDEDKFLYYGKYAIDFGSLNSIIVFIKYYCDKLDYDNAFIYYNKMQSFNDLNNNTYKQNVILKIGCYPIYYNFLYNLGLYDESSNVAKDFKKYYIGLELDNQYETLKAINEHIKKCKEQIDKAQKNQYSENILKKYFDEEVLNLMNDDNKIYILTSLNIYEYMKSIETTMDYSATLMPILKAIENILFEIVGEEYHTFISEKKDVNKIDIKGFLNRNDEFITKIDRLEYGKILSLLGRKDFYNNGRILPNNYFIEFCNKNNVENSKGVTIRIYTELDKLKEKRNLVAHKNRVYEDCVKECYDILLDNIKFINYLYTNFKFIFESKNNKYNEK